MTAWYEQPWQSVVASAEWAAELAAVPRTISGRIAVVSPAGDELADVPVTSCQIDFDGGKAERWALRAGLADSTWVPRGPSGLLHPMAGNRLRPYWRLHVSATAVVEIPCGTYWLDDPESSDAGAGVSLAVSGHDAVAHYRRGGYGGRTINVSGMTVTASVQAILDVLGVTEYRVAESSATLPDTFALGAGEPWDDVTDIAAMGGCDVWADRLGVIVVGPSPASDAVRLPWQEGPGNPVVSLRRTLTTSSIRNRVVAKSTSPEVVPPVVAVVQDDDPGSPTYVLGPFGVRETRIESDKIADSEGAEGMARATFERWRRATETLQVQARQRPDIEFRDLAAVSSRRAGAAGAWRVSGWSLDLPVPGSDPGPMTVTMQTRTTS